VHRQGSTDAHDSVQEEPVKRRNRDGEQLTVA
jgi:hypothetical protein